MWFASRIGLSIFDGMTWRNASDNDTAGPIRDGLVSIDDQGVVWWASMTHPLRVCRLDDGQWKTLPPINNTPRAWYSVGLQSFVNADGVSTVVVASHTGAIQMWTGTHWTTLPENIPERRVYSLEIDQSRLLISTNQGLYTADLNNPKELPRHVADLPQGPVLATASDATTNTTWVISDLWLARIINQKVDKVFPKPTAGQPIIKSMYSACLGPNGGFYFVDFNQAFHFHPQWGYEQFNVSSGLVTDDGNSVMMDREKNIWISSARGISKIINRRMACYDHTHGLLDDECTAVIQRSSGEIILGHRNGLTFFGPTMRARPFEFEPGVIKRVIDLHEDSKGQLWIAAYRKGLGLLNDDGTIEWHGPDQGLALPVYSILDHPTQGFLVGTSEGVFRKSGSQFKKITLPNISDGETPYVRRLIPLSGGKFAIATGNNGIYIWNDGNFSHFPGNNLDGTNSTYAVCELADNTIWVGSEHGLCKLDAHKLVLVNSNGPIIRKPIYAISKDNNANYWLGTDQGIVVWDGLKQTHLTTKEGLLGNETNRDAVMCDNDGRTWIGTESGVTVYRQEYEVTNRVAPILSLTNIIINGEPYNTEQPIKVNGPLGSLKVIVHAPYFSSDNPLTFRTRPTDDSDAKLPVHVQWPGILSLTNVPPGKFQVEIQAKTYNGLETNVVTIPTITIVPPLFQRWYSRMAMLAIGVFVLWLTFAFFTGRRYAKMLEDEVQLQTHDLRLSEEKALLESERLAGTMESISEGVVVMDGHGIILLMNPAAESMFGKSQESSLGHTMDRVLPITSIVDPDQVKLYQNWLSKPQGIRFLGLSVPIRNSDRQVCWLETSAVPISGSPGGIAHDFNNLLAIMLGNLSLAENTLTKNEEETRQLAKIRHASERAQRLTQQLLTFAKGGAPVREATDISNLVRDSVTFSLSGSNVTCQLNLPNNLWWAEIDVTQISQVIGNLVINAFQSMPEGGLLKISAQNSVSKQNSKQGQGSTFFMTLPAITTKSAKSKQKPSATSTPSDILKVLYMDDDEGIRDILGSMLQQLGHDSTGVPDGETALATFNQAREINSPFTLVILDLTIPGKMGGKETIRNLQKIDAQVPVIVASGYSNDKVMANFRNYGFSGILRKPFTTTDLKKVLDESV